MYEAGADGVFSEARGKDGVSVGARALAFVLAQNFHRQSGGKDLGFLQGCEGGVCGACVKQLGVLCSPSRRAQADAIGGGLSRNLR